MQVTWITRIVAATLLSAASVCFAADSDREQIERSTLRIDDKLRPIQYVVPDDKQKTAPQRLKIEILESGGSGKQLKQSAIQALPTRQMHPAHRRSMSQVVDNAVLFRRLPTVSMQVEPSVYRFFVTHPDVAVSIWKVLGISEFRMQNVERGRFTADAGDGTKGKIDVLFQTENECVALCNGLFQPSLPIKPIQAQAIIHLETSESKDRNGEPKITHRVDMFVAFPSQPVKVAVKLISPLGYRIIDKNFTEVSRFVKMMSVAMESRPDWVEAVGRRMEDVSAERKKELLELVIDTCSSVRKRHVSVYMQKGLEPKPLNSAGDIRTIRPASGFAPPRRLDLTTD